MPTVDPQVEPIALAKAKSDYEYEAERGKLSGVKCAEENCAKFIPTHNKRGKKRSGGYCDVCVIAWNLKK